MRQRVACLNPTCGAHRDRALPHTEICFVCGCGDWVPVPLNDADLDSQIDETFTRLIALLNLRSTWDDLPRFS